MVATVEQFRLFTQPSQGDQGQATTEALSNNTYRYHIWLGLDGAHHYTLNLLLNHGVELL